MLGPDFRTHTTLLADSAPVDGVINGSIYLKGGGDALLSANDISDMAKKLASTGVKRITGDVVCDDSYFSDGPYPEGWAWNYLSDDYAPQISALEVEEGVVSVSVEPGSAEGEKPTIHLYPLSAYIPVENKAKTSPAGSEAKLSIYRPYNKNVIVVTGSVPIDYKQVKPQKVTVDDPALYANTLLVEALFSSGITIDGSSHRGIAPASAVVVDTRESVSLNEYLPLMLKPSDNLLAESLYRVVAKEKAGDGSFKAGYGLEQQFLTEIRINPTEYSFTDSCGVSRLDLVTSDAILKLLIYAANQPDFKTYFDALPIGGVDGTLRKRFEFAPLKENVHAKTGTIQFCHTLCGYVSDKDDNLIAFAIVNNNFNCDSTNVSRIQDAVVGLLARYEGTGFAPVKPLVPKMPSELKPFVKSALHKHQSASQNSAKPKDESAETPATPRSEPTLALPSSVKPINASTEGPAGN
jgi:D-alanyl-D-alanine carboxypeptidase/D-alanyl-D-alanine-endopeptidase (penicillin-binding protein 4)